jgi:steroid delta-isomerase-like uncharacterized protein
VPTTPIREFSMQRNASVSQLFLKLMSSAPQKKNGIYCFQIVLFDDKINFKFCLSHFMDICHKIIDFVGPFICRYEYGYALRNFSFPHRFFISLFPWMRLFISEGKEGCQSPDLILIQEGWKQIMLLTCPSGFDSIVPSQKEETMCDTELLDQNKDLVRRLLLEVINEGNFELAESLIASDFVDHNPLPGLPPTKEGFKQSFMVFRNAFPDLKYTIDDIIAEDDRVAVRFTAAGTYTGELMGIPPRGQQVTVSGIDIFRVANEQLVELWLGWDQLGFMLQLGMELKPKVGE